MDPLRQLRAAAKVLREMDCRFGVAGGLAANLFRASHRLTRDVDLLFFGEPAEKSEQEGRKLLERLGLHVGVARVADLSRAPMMGKKTTPVAMLVGRRPTQEAEGGVDLLLPALSWVTEAVDRAQLHIVDFGFARLPTITVEDFILSKASALADNPSRYKDMDDLQAVFAADLPLDLVYLTSRFEKYRLSLPKDLARFAPKALQRAVKGAGQRR